MDYKRGVSPSRWLQVHPLPLTLYLTMSDIVIREVGCGVKNQLYNPNIHVFFNRLTLISRHSLRMYQETGAMSPFVIRLSQTIHPLLWIICYWRSFDRRQTDQRLTLDSRFHTLHYRDKRHHRQDGHSEV